MYAGCVSGASEMNDYMKFIQDAGFIGFEVHKQKEIKLPDTLLSEFNDSDEMNKFLNGQTGIFSITVSAYKPM
jgi:hypothetical protein